MPKPGRSSEYPIKKLQGLNLKDAADQVADNEFVSLQNVWKPVKGILARRFGSVIDISSFPLANRVSGVWRHYLQNGERFSLYHCEPNTSLMPDNTSDLVLTDLADGLGGIFAAWSGTVSTLRVCYSWIGLGSEQTYNSKNRAGFPSAGSFPLNASANPGHQTITLASGTSSLRVQCPVFPAGVRGANIFIAIGTHTQMTYMGTITTSNGTLTIRSSIGVNSSGTNTLTIAADPTGATTSTGTLKPGVYYVSYAWVNDPDTQEGAAVTSKGCSTVTVSKIVTVLPNQNAISIQTPASPSSDGATDLYIFIGTQPATYHPMTCVGLQTVGTTVNYDSIPSTNAQNGPHVNKLEAFTNGVSPFYNLVNSFNLGGPTATIGGRVQDRHGFLISKDGNGNVNEVFVSRSHFFLVFAFPFDAFTAGTLSDTFLSWFSAPKTANDRFKFPSDGAFSQPYNYNKTISDPQFTYFLGLSYFANGGDLPWQTDGRTLGQLGRVHSTNQTILPPMPRFIFTYQNSLVIAGADDQNQIYASNANAPNNWATAGDGSLLRFVTVGDAVGSGITAMGIFTPQTEATSNPNSFIIAFKKNGCWMVSGISDPTANTIVGNFGGQTPSPMIQVSGRVGCVAYRSIVQTPSGTIFLGQDGNVYLINSVSEPKKVGTKIQNALSHLVGNDAYMRKVTAVYHQSHYKISYPSAAALLNTPVVNDSELWADMRTEDSPITWVGPHAGRNIGAQVVLVGENDNLSRLVADDSVVRSYTADSTSSYADLAPNGSAQAIAYQITSKQFRFNEEAHSKRFWGAVLDMYIDMGFTNHCLFEGFADADYQAVNRTLSIGGATWDVSMWDQSNYADVAWMGFSFNFAATNLTGRVFQFRVSGADQAPFQLASVTLLLKPEKRRIIF